jgi:two-component system cell cycle response regulator
VFIVAVALAAALVSGLIVWRLAARPVERMKRRLADERAQFEALAHEDPLTGMPNKRAFHERLDTELRRAAREYYPVAVVAMDLDRFKQINDTHGHKTGDEVLVAAVHAMGTHMRAEDQLGRLGGEEFLVLLPDTDGEAATHMAERVRAEVASAPSPVPVTVSIGLATWAGETADEFLQRADEALYAAKDAGRDRVMAATLHGRT